MLGVIGGSGIYKLLKNAKTKRMATPYGNTSEPISLGGNMAFLPRHNKKHTLPPHKIPYRANIYAMKELGMDEIVRIGSAGILNKKIKPGEFVLPDDFIDFHQHTFFDSFAKGIKHIDFTEPFSEELRQKIIMASRTAKIRLRTKAVYVNTPGPRFETPAEIRAYRKLGGDLVGMTMIPEAVLAKELGLKYAGIVIGTNYAAGISKAPLSHEEVIKTIAKKEEEILKLISAIK